MEVALCTQYRASGASLLVEELYKVVLTYFMATFQPVDIDRGGAGGAILAVVSAVAQWLSTGKRMKVCAT
jgi:hypothetical protein